MQPSASLVLLCREATHLNCSQPLLYLQMGVRGGRKNCLPIHVPVMRMGCTGATPVMMWEPLHKLPALGLHSCTVRGGWNQCRGTEEQDAGSQQAPSLLLAGTGILVGAALWGPICAALRAAPVALVPGRAGGQLCGDRRARAGLGCAGAGAELRRHRGTGVVVGVGVAAGQAGGQRGAAVAGAAVLQQDVDALLAARPPGIGQWGQPSSVLALHIHSVLHRREAAVQWYQGTGCPRAQEWQGALGPWGRQEEGAGRVGRSVPVGMWGNPQKQDG